MAPKSLKVWLADYIWEEISHAITWRHNISNGIKTDLDERFNDDGSNFRCVSSPPEGSDVQLIKVISTKDTVIGFVSDGTVKVKAQFSDDAVATFEEATEESLDVDVTGDVFQIKKVTIITTPFGPADGFVQLYIEELWYKHHLRKTDGSPSPIEDNENIRLLIDNIKDIRVPPIKEEPEDDIGPISSTPNPKPKRPSPIEIDSDTEIVPYKAASKTQVQATQRKGLSLSRDGYEIKKGVNLAQPTSANALLDMLSKEKKRPISKPTPTAATWSKPAPPPPAARQTAAPPRQEADVKMRDTSPELEPAPPVSNQLSTAIVNETPIKARASQSDNLKYGRRKIPENQKRLLETASAWHPAPPGRTPVHPNVPVELLVKWNAEVAAEAPVPSQPASMAPSQKTAPSKQQAESSSGSSDDSSDEELIPEKDWPASQSIYSPTQSPAKPTLKKAPPPSSATDHLEVAAPQTLPTEPKAMRSPARMDRHLQQHPAERLRHQRDDHMNNDRRKAWLKAHFRPYVTGSFTLKDLALQYQQEHSVPATQTDFLNAARTVFAHLTMPISQRFCRSEEAQAAKQGRRGARPSSQLMGKLNFEGTNEMFGALAHEFTCKKLISHLGPK